MINTLPSELEKTLATRWSDYLDTDWVRHSDSVYSISLLDWDQTWYVMRAVLSDDGRWSIIPIAGFFERIEGTLTWGGN